MEEERQALVENVRGALKENGLSFQEWELREQELMRAAVTRQQRGHLLETFFRHLFSQVCTWDQIWCVHLHVWVCIRVCVCVCACASVVTSFPI